MKRLTIASLILFLLSLTLSSISLAAICNCTGGVCSGGIPCNAQGCTASCNTSPAPASVPKVQSPPPTPVQTPKIHVPSVKLFDPTNFIFVMFRGNITFPHHTSHLLWIPAQRFNSLDELIGKEDSIRSGMEIERERKIRFGMERNNIFGQEEDDHIYGEDYIRGNDSESDKIMGGPGSDLIIIGGEEVYTVNNGDGGDLISGGSGDDIVSGDEGKDKLIGGNNEGLIDDDTIRGGKGDNLILGFSGDDDNEIENRGYDDFSIINFVLKDTYSAIINSGPDLIDSFIENPNDFAQIYTYVIEPGRIYVDEEDGTLWYLDEDGYINTENGERYVYDGPIPSLTIRSILSFENNNLLNVTEKLPNSWKVYGDPEIPGSAFVADLGGFSDDEKSNVNDTFSDAGFKILDGYQGPLWGVYTSQDILAPATSATWKYNMYSFLDNGNWVMASDKPPIYPIPLDNWPTSVLNLPPLDPAPSINSPLNITIDGRSLSTGDGPIYFFPSFGTNPDQEDYSDSYSPASAEVFEIDGENIVIDFNGVPNDTMIETKDFFDSIGAKRIEDAEGKISMFIAPSFAFDQPLEKNCLLFFILISVSAFASFMGGIVMFRLNSDTFSE